MKRFVSTIFFLFLAIIFIGCDSKDVTITELEVIGEQNEFDQNFELSNLKLKVTKSDGSVEYVPLSEEMINSSDLNKFSTEGTHTISVKYLNNSATFTITISGEKGDDGREVELRVFDGYIQWRHEGDSTWNNLISVSELKGTSGADGAAGREVEFQTTAEYVQWRYEGDTAWKNLMALTALKGSDGAAGREVEFQTTADYVQWRYAGDSAWINLIDLTLLKGADGAAATIGISEDGYWVINGEKTIYKVVPEMVEPPLCTVSFDLAGGEMPEGFDSEIEVAKGDSIVLPIPAKDGYLFAGWFTGDTVNDGQFLNFHTVTKNITLYAHWELDYQVLIDYFNLFKEQNCTVSFDGHSTYLYEDGYYESEMYEVYKQFFLNDDLFISVEDGEKEIISDYIVDVLESQQYAILHDKHVYSMIFDNDDYLNFDSFPDYYHGFNRKHLYFARYFQADSFDQYVDVTEFDRREGTNIYDYRQPVEFIMGLYQLDSLDYEALNPSVYLNLETLTLTIESCFDLGDGQFQELNVAITLSAVGSTYFELPIEQIVLLAHKELDNIIEYYNPYCMDSDSYEFFMSLIDEARIGLDDALDFVDYVTIIKENNNVINYHLDYFNYDDLKTGIFYNKKNLKHFIDSYIVTATDDCKDELVDLLDSYYHQLDAVGSNEEMNDLINQLLLDFQDIYIEDEDKALLLEAKEEAVSNLDDLISTFIDTLKYQENERLLEYLLGYYTNLISSALDTETVDYHYASAKEELESLSLLADTIALGYIQSLYKDILEDLFDCVYASFDETHFDIYLELLSYMDAILYAQDFMTLYNAYDTGMNTIQESLIIAFKNELLNDLAEAYEYCMKVARDEDLGGFTATYENLVNTVLETENLFDLLCNKLPYIAQLSNFEPDELKEVRNYRLDKLTKYFEYCIKTAIDDSILVIEGIYNIAYAEIAACGDLTLLMNRYNKAIEDIDNAYELDFQKMALFEFIMFNCEKIENWICYYSNLDYSKEYQYYLIERNLAEYIDKLMSAASIDDVNNLIEECQITLESLRLTFIVDFNKLKSEYLDEFETFYWNLKSELRKLYDSSYLADYDANCLTYRAYINDSANVLDLVYYTNSSYWYLYEVLINSCKAMILKEIDNGYTYSRQIIIDEELDLLDSEYSSVRSLILITYDVYSIYSYQHEFRNFLPTLSTSFLRKEILSSKMELKDLIDYCKLTATEQSIIDLDELYSNYFALYDTCESPEEVYQYNDEMYSAIGGAYIMDFNKYVVHYEITRYKNLIEFYNDVVTDLTSDAEYLYNVTDMGLITTEDLDNAGSINEVMQIYNAWSLVAPYGDFEYRENTISYFKYSCINMLDSLFYNHPDCDQEFIDLHQSYINNINDADSVKVIYQQFEEGYLALDVEINEYFCDSLMTAISNFYDEHSIEFSGDTLIEFEEFYGYVNQKYLEYPYPSIVNYLYEALVKLYYELSK